jgi:MFS family permease
MNAFQKAPNAKKWMTLIGIYLALIASLMVSVTNSVMLPIAAAEIGGMDIYSVAANIGGVVGIAAMPLFGFFGAKNPAIKRLLVVFSMACGVVCMLGRAVAPSMEFVIIMGIFWGLVSPGVYVIGFSMIRDMYDQKQSGIYLGLIGTVMSIGMLAGPFIGGIVMNFSWRIWCHILWILLSIAALLIFFGVSAKKDEVADMASVGARFDLPGALALTIVLGGLILNLSFGSSYIPLGGIASNIIFVLVVVGLIWLIFVMRKKGADAIIPLPAIKDRNTLGFALSNFLSNFSAIAVLFFVPGYVVRTLSADPLVTTLGTALAASLPTTLIAVIGLFLGPVFGRLIAKRGDAKLIIWIGAITRVVVIGGFVLLLNPTTPVWLVYVLMFVAGVYNSQNTVAFSAGPQIQLKPEFRVTGNSVIQVGQNLGSGVGMALYTLIIAAVPAMGMTVSLGIALVASVLMFFSAAMLQKAQAPAQEGEKK